MTLLLFKELLALNEEFSRVNRGLERMQREPVYNKEMICWAKAHAESPQVEANRQFFNEFDAIVENDATKAYKFLRDHKRRVTDPDDVYLEIRNREEARKAKGLPPRVVILPDWDFGDEKRYEEQQIKRRNRASTRRAGPQQRAPKLAKTSQPQTASLGFDTEQAREGGNLP
jgi:hypothetical protein